MKSWDANALAIINSESGLRATGVLLYPLDGSRLDLTDYSETLAVTVPLDGGTVAASFSPVVLEQAGEPEYGNPNSAVVTLQVGDPARTLRTLARGGLLIGARVVVYDLWSSDGATWYPVLLFDGSLERPGTGDDPMIELEAGPSLMLWAGSAPETVGVRCPYVSTSQCAYVGACAQTPAACTANGQLANYGGNLYLVMAGTTVEFHDTASSVRADAANGQSGSRPVVRGF